MFDYLFKRRRWNTALDIAQPPPKGAGTDIPAPPPPRVEFQPIRSRGTFVAATVIGLLSIFAPPPLDPQPPPNPTNISQPLPRRQLRLLDQREHNRPASLIEPAQNPTEISDPTPYRQLAKSFQQAITLGLRELGGEPPPNPDWISDPQPYRQGGLAERSLRTGLDHGSNEQPAHP